MKLSHEIILVLFALVFTATAGSCEHWWEPCGEVQNNSKHNMKYTTKFADDRTGPHFCDTWNHNGGNTVKNAQVSCNQKDNGRGGHKGGGKVDVDAFTFADRDYIVQVNGARSRTIKKGIWTKIESHQLATCWDDVILGKVGCTVQF